MCRQFAAIVLALLGAVASAEDLSVAPLAKRGNPKQMVHAHLMRLAQEALDRRDANYEKVKSAEDVKAWQDKRREFFIKALGGFPERTPLNARVVGTIEREGFRIEKVIYESRPQHFVTALLYLPHAKPPYPGVLVPCGHSDNGKASEAYQRVCILLATHGMAALCYDPIDQGERMQLLDEAGKPVARGTVGHCLTGVGSALLGYNTATYRVWDGMRSLDYLASRKEIDAARLGCTGNSGGGTLTSYLMALDERIVCAAPSCYLCGFRRLLETIGAQDAEQCIAGQIAFGMDHADYVLMRAPRPTLMCVATHDFFDITGAWNAFRQGKRAYTRLGAPEACGIAEADEKHGFTPRLRMAAAQWMRRWLLKNDAPLDTEPTVAVLTDKEALCTPDGQVMRLAGAKSVYDFNAAAEKELAVKRQSIRKHIRAEEALDEVRVRTGIRPLKALPEPKATKLGAIARDGYRIDQYAIEVESDIWLPALAFVPEKPAKEACLYLHEDGKAADAAVGGPIEKLVQRGRLVLAVDLRGTGEMQATGGGGYGKYLGPEWADGFLAYMLDRPFLAMRAEDVLQSARFLASLENGDGKRPLHVFSSGRVGPPALHAVALEPQLFASLTLYHCLENWSQVVGTPLARNQFVNVVHGVLRGYDLPDLAATLPQEKLTISKPLTAKEEPAWK